MYKCPTCGKEHPIPHQSQFPIFIKYFDVAPDGDPDDITDTLSPSPQYKLCKTPEEIPSGVNFNIIATKVEIG